MDWFIVPQIRPKPTTGVYSDWKVPIATNCRNQCVYCTISEGEYGGIDNFHIEHFRPKSIFGALENEIDNLFLACAICNRFKSDEWPGEPQIAGNTATFLDPSTANYHSHISFAPDATLSGQTVAGIYIIERLFLNRGQLIISRRYRRALRSLMAVTDTFDQTLDDLASLGTEGASIMREIAQASTRVNRLQARLTTAQPYQAAEAKRTAKKKSTTRTVKKRKSA